MKYIILTFALLVAFTNVQAFAKHQGINGFGPGLTQYMETESDPWAQYNLGVMYYTGNGVQKDYTQAAYWFTKAANAGDAEAQFNLGAMYYSGTGVTQDYKLAAKWFNDAAQQGDSRAMFNMGLLYGMGEGVEQDIVQSYMWFSLSHHESAEFNMNVLAEEMTPEQIQEAERLATNFKRR